MELLTMRESIEHAVITQFLGGYVSEGEACDRLGIHRSTLYRKIKRFLESGPKGLIHRLRGKSSNHAADPILKKAICNLFDTKYKPYGFKVAHFYQEASHNFPEPVGYSTVIRWLKQAKLITKSHKGWRHHSRRPRREAFGELIQMDTSIHDWLDWGKNFALISGIDDATNIICGALITETDTTLGNMSVLRQILDSYGLFAALYVDKSPIFKVTRTGGFGRITQPTYNADYITQVKRALSDLKIELIYAHSPQAKGRIERSFGTWQSRLIPELRKRGIKRIDTANKYIQETFIPKHNRLFAKDPKKFPNAFIPIKDLNLDYILAEHYRLTVTNDHIVSSKRAGLVLKILPSKNRLCYAKAKVDVFKHTDKSISVLYKNQPLNFVRIE